MSEILTLCAVMLFTGFIIWVIISDYRLSLNINQAPTLMEGLESMDADVKKTSNGESGNAANYAAKIKAIVVKLQDELLISKYRNDYENVIVNVDDLISFLMVKQVLNINVDGGADTITGLQKLTALKESKEALNATMVFLDKQ
mgnify:FL=1